MRTRPARSTAPLPLLLALTIPGALPACGLLSASDFTGLRAADVPDAGDSQTDGGSAGSDQPDSGPGQAVPPALGTGGAMQPPPSMVQPSSSLLGAVSGAGGADAADDGGGGTFGGSDESSAGAAGDLTRSVAPPLEPFERCSQDFGVVDTPSHAIATSLALANFSGWRPVSTFGLPGDNAFISAPAAASRSSSSVYLFGRSADGLWQNFGLALQNSTVWTWLGWSTLRTPPTWLGGVSSTVFGERGLALATRGTSPDKLIRAYVRACLAPPAGSSAGADGIWSDWVMIDGGNLISDPMIVFSDPNLFVFSQGTDYQFYFSMYQPGAIFDSGRWSEWQVIENGIWAAGPGVAARPDGTLFVAALSTAGRYYLTTSSDRGLTWSAWTRVESGTLRFNSAPVLATAPTLDGSLSIFGTGMDQQMWTSTSSDGGLTWGPFQAPPLSRLDTAPAAVSPREGVVHTFGLGTDSAIWMDPYRE